MTNKLFVVVVSEVFLQLSMLSTISMSRTSPFYLILELNLCFFPTCQDFENITRHNIEILQTSKF